MKTWKIIKFFLYIVLAFVVLVFKDFWIENLKWLIGSLICMYAMEPIIVAICTKKDEWLEDYNLFNGIFVLVLGVVTLAFIRTNVVDDEGYKTICVIWAVWAILREAGEIKEAIELLKEKEPAYLTIIESLVTLYFSVTLLMEPGEHHAMIHLYLLFIELITAVLFPQLRGIYNRFIRKEKNTDE